MTALLCRLTVAIAARDHPPCSRSQRQRKRGLLLVQSTAVTRRHLCHSLTSGRARDVTGAEAVGVATHASFVLLTGARSTAVEGPSCAPTAASPCSLPESPARLARYRNFYLLYTAAGSLASDETRLSRNSWRLPPPCIMAWAGRRVRRGQRLASSGLVRGLAHPTPNARPV